MTHHKQIKFSAIIPAYNSQNYIKKCLDSLLEQIYLPYEIIIVDDGSTDNTASIIKSYDNKIIKYFYQENSGPGAARNYAIQKATGDYLLIIDSDDYIDNHLIKICSEKIYKDYNPDIVHFDLKRLNDNNTIDFRKINKKLITKDRLLDKECELLLNNRAYYTCNSVYNSNFIKKHNIKYGGNYVYEDNEFFVSAVINAKKISIIHAPLYYYRIYDTSTSRDNPATQIEGRLKSIEACQRVLTDADADDSARALYSAHAYKMFIHTLGEKTSNELIRDSIIKYVDLVSGFDFTVPDSMNNKFSRLYRDGVFKNKKYETVSLAVSEKLDKRKSAETTNEKPKKNIKMMIYNFLSQISLEDSILIIENKNPHWSRMLYNELVSHFPHKKIIYASKDDNFGQIKKNSKRYYSVLARSRIVILDAYDLFNIDKRKDQIWIQMLSNHNILKCLYDTGEPYYSKKKIERRLKNYQSVEKWDYIIADNDLFKSHYVSGFLKNNENIIIHRLIDSKSTESITKDDYNNIKNEFNIPQNKKIIYYCPSKRYYNRGSNINFDYLADIISISSKLGDEYCALTKNVKHRNGELFSEGKIKDVSKYDDFRLLKISDYVISDYSANIFYALNMKKNIVLYQHDLEKVQQERGIYDDINEELKPFIAEDSDSIVDMIENYNKTDHLEALHKKLYSSNNSYLYSEIKSIMQWT